MQQEKERKDIETERKKISYLYSQMTCLSISKNPVLSTKEILEFISEFSKVSGESVYKNQCVSHGY